MSWQPNIFTPTLLVTAGFGLIVMFLVARRYPKPGAFWLATTLAAVSWWALAQGCELAASQTGWRIFWFTMRFFAIAIAPTAFLLYALQFSGLIERASILKQIKWIAVFPSLLILTVLTNSLHHGVWSGYELHTKKMITALVYDYQTLYWMFAGITWLIMFLAFLVMFIAVVRYKYLFRKQAILLLAAVMVPLIGNIFTQSLREILVIDITGLLFLVSITLIFIDLLQNRLLDLVPVSPDQMNRRFRDAAVVVDLQGRVLDLNQTAALLLNAPAATLVGTSLRDRMQQLPPITNANDTTEKLGISGFIVDGKERWYELRANALSGLNARILYFDDVTDRRASDTEIATERRRANLLLNIANVSTETLSLDDMMRSTLQLTCQISQARSALLVLFSDLGKPLHHMVYGTGIPETHCVALADQVRQRQASINLPDVSQNATWIGVSEYQSAPAGTALAMPLYYGRQISGALVLYHPLVNQFAQTDTVVLEAATRQMSLALGNALIIHGQRMVSDAQTTLFETLRSLQHPMAIAEAMTQVTSVISRRTGWPLVALLAYNPSGQAAVFTAAGRLSGAFKKRYLVNRNNLQFQNTSSPLNVFNIDDYPSAVLLPLSGLPRHLLLIASDMPLAFDDHTRWLANSLGNVAGLVLRNAQLNEDMVTERQRLKALVQSSHDGIVMIGNDSKLLVVSQQALRLMELPNTPEYWLSKAFVDVLMVLRHKAPAMVHTIAREIRRASRGDTGSGSGEVQVGERFIAWTNLPVRDQHRNLGRLFILRDVTEERQIAQMREDLTHTMVHDLKSPLTGIHSSLLLLEDRITDTGNDEHAIIDIAKRSNDRLLQMVNAILDISRLESGRMPLQITSFAINQLVSDVVLSQSPSAIEKQIVVENQVSKTMPKVSADRDLIARVLENLTSNALKFTPPNGTIRIRCLLQNESIVLSIFNSGPGIPPEVKHRLFQKFVTGLQRGHGSGLGLAFCRMVMEAHQQKIWAESTPDEGATFFFTLPISR